MSGHLGVRLRTLCHFWHYCKCVSICNSEDYEEKKFVAKTENITLGGMLDRWVEEELKPGTLSNGGLEDFHFHVLRHTYTSNLLSNGAAPKDVQELLGHADVSTTMNVYAHATREAKRTSARLLDKAVGGN